MLRVADAIEKNTTPGMTFGMSSFAAPHTYGTEACLAGWAVLVLDDVTGRELQRMADDDLILDRAAELFDLNYTEADALFLPEDSAAFFCRNPQEGAAQLRYAAETGDCRWPHDRGDA